MMVDGSEVVARVGNQVILAGDILGVVAKDLKDVQKEMPKETFEQYKRMVLEKVTPDAVDMKLAYLDFLRQVPQDKHVDLHNKVGVAFNENALPDLLKAYDAESLPELESKLRAIGTSLAKQRQFFIEQVIVMEAVKAHLDLESEVTHQQLLSYYESRKETYFKPERARWEQLVVQIDKFPSRRDAALEIIDMGNEVLRGASLESVAKRRSHGSGAADGGQRDWTARGSLASKPLEDAVFSTPIGEMSAIVQDDRNFYIIRVLEREKEHYTPFTDLQDEIKKKIQIERAEAKRAEYMASLKKKTHVWCAFDTKPTDISRTATKPSATPRR